MKARTKMCEKYEGWTNHETWATNLWIDNTYGLYITAQGLAKESENIYDLADKLRDLVEGLFDYDSVKRNHELFLMLTDIGSLYRVNWKEVAEHQLSAAKESASL